MMVFCVKCCLTAIPLHNAPHHQASQEVLNKLCTQQDWQSAYLTERIPIKVLVMMTVQEDPSEPQEFTPFQALSWSTAAKGCRPRVRLQHELA
jgi:hypothetical protein